MPKNIRKFLVPVITVAVIVLILLAPGAPVQNSPSGRAPQGAGSVEQVPLPGGGVTVGDPVEPTTTIAFRDLPEVESEPLLDREINPRLNVTGSLPPDFEVEGGLDPLLSLQLEAPQFTGRAFETPLLNFEGQGYTFVQPPDTEGDVGLNYYVQMINGSSGAQMIVYDKNGNAVHGPRLIDQMGSGNCASGMGDPIVLYDHQAQRWLLSEFSSGGNHLCVYISQTSDPAGTYWVYDFEATNFPDYPKYAVWSNAYIVTTNENSPAVYALQRNQMLAGGAAAYQRFTVPGLAGFGFEALTPADPDGEIPPPAGADPIVMRHRDDEVHNPPGSPGTDYLDLWSIDIDWSNPGNSSINALPSIPIAEFDSTLCGLVSFACFPQPNTTVTLDPIREVIMWRLQYRNFEQYETLVGNLVTDVTGTDRGGIRWFELRRTYPGAWSLFQEGTYSPDSDNRWMGAIAMDGFGNIALGYNVSSSSTYPSLRYTGRQSTDPLNVMTQVETTLAVGEASNIGPYGNRYGDYAAMSVDPEDDCTFWFTGEYNPTSEWSTRIATLKFDSCEPEPSFVLEASPPSQAVCSPTDAVFDVAVSGYYGWNTPVTLSLENLHEGASSDFSPNPVNPVSGTVTSQLIISDTLQASPGVETLQIVGTSLTRTMTTTVELGIYHPPSAPVIETNSPVTLGEPVQFTAVVTSTIPLTYTWDFGDPGSGINLDGPTPEFTYDEAGTYTVTLTVSNDWCGNSSTVEVVVNPPDEYLLFLPHLER